MCPVNDLHFTPTGVSLQPLQTFNHYVVVMRACLLSRAQFSEASPLRLLGRNPPEHKQHAALQTTLSPQLCCPAAAATRHHLLAEDTLQADNQARRSSRSSAASSGSFQKRKHRRRAQSPRASIRRKTR